MRDLCPLGYLFWYVPYHDLTLNNTTLIIWCKYIRKVSKFQTNGHAGSRWGNKPKIKYKIVKYTSYNHPAFLLSRAVSASTLTRFIWRLFSTYMINKSLLVCLRNINYNSQFNRASILFRISFVIKVTWCFVT